IMVFAVLCWASALMIPRTGEGAPHLVVQANIVSSTADLLRHLRHDSRLWWGGVVASWFWLLAAVGLWLRPPMVKTTLGGTEESGNAFLAIFSVCIAIGSGLAAFLAHGRIVLLPTVIAAFLLGVFSLDLGLATYTAVPPATPQNAVAIFSSFRGIRIA